MKIIFLFLKNKEMIKKIEYASFKKLLIFGTKGVGKTSLAKSFDQNYFFEEVEPSKDSKKIQ